MGCSGITRSGERCRAQPLPDSDYCVAHSPTISNETRRGWRAKGGRNSAAQVRAKRQLPMEPLSAEEVASYLSLGIRGVLTGSVAPAVLTAMSNAARALAEMRRDIEFAERLAALEAANAPVDLRRGA